MQENCGKERELKTGSRSKLGEKRDVLFEITNDNLNLCLWERNENPALAKEVAVFRPFELRDRRVSTTKLTFDADVQKIMLDQSVDPCACSNLREDLQRLADIFFTVSESRDTRFRLFTTIDDDCQRFHVDYKHLRMICTYQGPGTEWLTEDQANREAYADGGSNEDIIRYGTPGRFKTSWVGILKDDRFPGNRGGGLMHRSPSLAGFQDTRVVFCLESAPL